MRRSISSLFSLTLALAGCGGGGDDDSQDPGDDSPSDDSPSDDSSDDGTDDGSAQEDFLQVAYSDVTETETGTFAADNENAGEAFSTFVSATQADGELIILAYQVTDAEEATRPARPRAPRPRCRSALPSATKTPGSSTPWPPAR